MGDRGEEREKSEGGKEENRRTKGRKDMGRGAREKLCSLKKLR